MKSKRTKGIYKVLGIPYNIIIVGLVIIPFFIMILYSFNKGSGPFELNFTLSYYSQFLANKQFMSTMFESLYLAVITTFVTFLVAYPLAYIITQSSPGKRMVLLLVVTSPMWINMLIQVNAIKQIVSIVNINLMGSNLVIIIGMVYMFLPYMVLPIYTSLSKIDKSLYESSSDLGANKYQMIRRVIFPLSFPGVMSGIMMVFLPAATTIIVTEYLGMGQRYMIGNLIEQIIINSGDYGFGSAIAIVLVAIMLLIVYGISKLGSYKEVDELE